MTTDRYFSHDQNARHDPKVKAIMTLFKKGYQFFFCTVEYMFGQGGELEMNSYFWDALKSEISADSAAQTKRFIEKASGTEIPLFYIVKRKGKEYLRSKSLDGRLDKIQSKSDSARDSANQRWAQEAKKPKKVFADDSVEMQIAKRIYGDFAKRFGAKEPNYQAWCRDVDLILRRDKYEVTFVNETLDAVAKHEGTNGFRWGDVIRSPAKLRKHLQSGMISPTLSSRGRMTGGVKAKTGKYDNV